MKVLLADSCNLFLEGLQNLLRSYGLEVVSVVSDKSETWQNAGLFEPVVIIINITGDGEEKLEVIRQFKTAIPTAHIIVITDDEENLLKASQNGASGYLLTDIHIEQVMQKIHEVEREWQCQEAING